MLDSLFNKVAGLRAQLSVKFEKFLRAPILKNIYEPLLLYLQVVLFTMHEKDTAKEA